MTWFRCIGSNGGGDSKTVVRYASFNGSGYITLPYTVSADYKITVDYYVPKYVDNMAIIGNTVSGDYTHLTLFSSRYYTTTGSAETNFAGNTVGRHTFINNVNNHNSLDSEDVTSYTPTDNSNATLTIGYRYGAPNNFVGKIYEYKIESISTGDIICHIKPTKYQGELVFRDIINGINYSCSGMYVIEEPDYGEFDSYIASSGQQYIALPLYSDDYPVIKTKMMLGYLPGTQQALWGDIWDVNSFMLYAENSAFSFRYTTNNVDVITPKYWEWVDVEFDYTKGTFLYAGDVYGGTPKTQLHNQIYLFGLPSGRDGWCAYSTIEVYKNGTLYMNLEPRLDKETNAGYYYDTINNIPYYSSTSYPLVYGAMSSDDPEEVSTNLPALGSTGHQWIELPLYADDYPIIEFKLLQTEYQQGGVIVGDEWSADGFMLYMYSGGNEFRYGTDNIVSFPIKYWKWVDVRIDYTTGTIVYDGVTYGGTPKTQLHKQVKLFGFSNYSCKSVAIADIKIYKNDTLYMQLEARNDETTEAGYFYDTIGNQSYYSDSSYPLLYTVATKPYMELRYSSGTAGTESHMVTETGKYLIINGWSWQGSQGVGKGVTTLPSGVTPIIDEEILNSSTFGYRLTIADLQVGDVVTMTNYDAGWIANTKMIFKINDISPTSVIYQSTAGDNWIDVSSIPGSGKALFIGACCGKTASNEQQVRDVSIKNASANYDYDMSGYINTNFFIRIVYCDIADMPHYKMYGYDGGFAGLAVIQ